MRTPSLLDVPKTHPSRQEKLAAWKKQYNVETHDAGKSFGPDRWAAASLLECRKFLRAYGASEKDDLFQLFHKWGGLLDDNDLLHYGDTEREAINSVCYAHNLPLP